MSEDPSQVVIDPQAVRELDAGLIEAARCPDDLIGARRDRFLAFQPLHHLIRFLHAQPGWRPAALHLTKLQSALNDLEHGYVAPMLSPVSVSGRPVSSHEAMLRGAAAGIMGGLMKYGGMSKPTAAEWVSTRLRAAGYEVRPGTVIDWRQKALNHKSSPQAYNFFRTVIDDPAWRSSPVDFAELLVSRFIELQLRKEE